MYLGEVRRRLYILPGSSWGDVDRLTAPLLGQPTQECLQTILGRGGLIHTVCLTLQSNQRFQAVGELVHRSRVGTERDSRQHCRPTLSRADRATLASDLGRHRLKRLPVLAHKGQIIKQSS